MNSNISFTNLDFGSLMQNITKSLMLILAIGLFISILPNKSFGQKETAPTGVKAFEHMAEYLARGTGQWKAPAPKRAGGPDAYGLWFKRTTRGRLLELSIVLYFGDKVRTGIKGYWFWHPGQRKIVYHEISPGGQVRTGTAHFTDNQTFINLTDAFGRDGKPKPNRGENVFLSENEHRTTAYKKDAEGKWVKQLGLTWIRGSKLVKSGE